MRYTTILFDADDTLLDFRRAEQTALRKVFAANGLRTDDAFLAAYMQINHTLWKSFDHGEIPKSEITRTRFVQLFARFDIPLDGVRFNELYLDCLSEYGFTLPGMRGLCRDLYAGGYQLYIITNGFERVQKSRFAKSGLAPYFRDVFISEQIGAAKPQQAFFDRVLSCLPEQNKEKIIVVGDSLVTDIAGAVHAGLASCWCDFNKTNAPNAASCRAENPAQLKKILEEDHE